MRRPSLAQCPPRLAAVATQVAERLARAGHRAWVVGGSVRDLALGRTPEDIDMTSAATPPEVESLFEHVVPLGRAFGTLQLLIDGVEVEHTTFRSEAGYADSRRPTSVRFGRTLEEDAARRDFTCNALYLDPLTDAVADPTGGLADLERGLLRTVGEPGERFREDGLRLVRMARFAAGLGLEIEPATWSAALGSTAALSGVSVERALAELERMFAAPGAPRAVELLYGAGLLGLLLPGLDALRGPELEPARARSLRLAALRALGPAPGAALGFAVLLDPDPTGTAGSLDRAAETLERLRPSRELRRAVEGLLRLRRLVEALLARPDPPRSERVRVVRETLFEDAARLAGAFRAALGRECEPVDALVSWARSLAAEALRPRPLLSSEDLARAGVPRDASLGAALRALETEQLDGRLTTREQALAWLAARSR